MRGSLSPNGAILAGMARFVLSRATLRFWKNLE